jgi:hypothetical protein
VGAEKLAGADDQVQSPRIKARGARREVAVQLDSTRLTPNVPIKRPPSAPLAPEVRNPRGPGVMAGGFVAAGGRW